MKIHIYGKNKPITRGFDKDGNYKEWKTANYSGHRIAETMTKAQTIMQEMISKDWDISIEVETAR